MADEPYILVLSSNSIERAIQRANLPEDRCIIRESVGLTSIPLFQMKDYLQPTCDAVEQKGYPPSAIISCPFFADLFLFMAEKSPVMQKFKGKVHLVCSMQRSEYEETLPALFARSDLSENYAPDSRFETVTKLLLEVFEEHGITPSAPRSARGQ